MLVLRGSKSHVTVSPTFIVSTSGVKAQPVLICHEQFMFATTLGSDAEYAIVTVKLALPRFPALSIAVQVTVVVPIGNKEPESGLQFVLREPLTLSDAEAVNVEVIPEDEGVETEMLSGG